MVLPSFMFMALWNVERCFVTTKIYVHNVGSYYIKNGLTLLFFCHSWIYVFIKNFKIIEFFIGRTYLTYQVELF